MSQANTGAGLEARDAKVVDQLLRGQLQQVAAGDLCERARVAEAHLAQQRAGLRRREPAAKKDVAVAGKGLLISSRSSCKHIVGVAVEHQAFKPLQLQEAGQSGSA